MNIETAANKFYKSINGKIEFEVVEKQIKSSGFQVLFFNTPVGDAELIRYAQTEKAKTTKAFTYVGTAKIIFIDNFLSVEDKLYLLLHEVGHITLKHLEFERISTHNKILLDIDADSFVYFLLSGKRKTAFPAVISVAILVVVAVIFLCFFEKGSLSPASKYISGVKSDYVLITSTGSCYHRDSCITISESLTAQMELREAQKLFTPCKICNPQ